MGGPPAETTDDMTASPPRAGSAFQCIAAIHVLCFLTVNVSFIWGSTRYESQNICRQLGVYCFIYTENLEETHNMRRRRGQATYSRRRQAGTNGAWSSMGKRRMGARRGRAAAAGRRLFSGTLGTFWQIACFWGYHSGLICFSFPCYFLPGVKTRGGGGGDRGSKGFQVCRLRHPAPL